MRKHYLHIIWVLVTVLASNEVCSAQAKDSKFEAQSDSINVQKIDSLNQAIVRRTDIVLDKIDTLNSISIHNKLDSLSGSITFKIDSLQKLPDVDSNLLTTLDSVKQKIEGIKIDADQLGLDKVNGEIGSIQERLNSKPQKFERNVNDKLGLFADNGANVPGGIDVPTAEIPKLNMDQSALDTGLNLSSPELPSIGEVGDLNIEGLDPNLGDISAISEQAGKYGSDLKIITSGNLEDVEQIPASLESELENLDGVDQLEQGTSQMESYTELTKNINDPHMRKELALEKAKKHTGNHFLGHEKELEAAIEQMSKIKSKYQGASEVIDLFQKRRGNTMKGKPFVQRLVPSLTMQILYNQNLMVDFNPLMGYRLSGRFTTGLGLNYRVIIDFKEIKLPTEERIYGPRSFLNFKLKDNFQLRAEVESMYSKNRFPYFNLANDTKLKGWRTSYFAGIKRDFKFSKKVTGNVQFLYNLHDPKKRSPYNERFNIRFGFEFPYHPKSVKPE